MQTSREAVPETQQTAETLEIIAVAKALQEKIQVHLRAHYSKAVQTTSKVSSFWVDTGKFNNVKKPLATALSELCGMTLHSLTEVAYFIAYYEYAIKVNRQHDPKHFFDRLRAKPEGGQLGKLLESHQEPIAALKTKLIEEKDARKNAVKWRLAILYQHLAMAEQMNDAKMMTSNFSFVEMEIGYGRKQRQLPLQSYHVSKLKELEDRFELNENQQAKQTSGLLSNLKKECIDPKEFEKLQRMIAADKEELKPLLGDENCLDKLIAVLKNKIGDLRKERIEIDAIEHFSDGPAYLHSCPEERVRKLVRAEILRSFEDSLIFEEKAYLWMLSVKSCQIYMRQVKEQTTRISEQVNLRIETSNLYNKDGFTPLLSNKELRDDIIHNADISGPHDDEELTKEIMEAINEQLESHINSRNRLRDSRNLEHENVDWKPLFWKDGYVGERCHWVVRLRQFIDEVLIKPLDNLDKTVSKYLQQDASLPSLDKEDECLNSQTNDTLIKHAISLLQGTRNFDLCIDKHCEQIKKWDEESRQARHTFMV